MDWRNFSNKNESRCGIMLEKSLPTPLSSRLALPIWSRESEANRTKLFELKYLITETIRYFFRRRGVVKIKIWKSPTYKRNHIFTIVV